MKYTEALKLNCSSGGESMRTDNLIINGYGSSNGDEFHKVQLNGKGTVNGNVECEQFECNGYGAVTGDLKVAVHELADLVKLMVQFMLKR